MSLQNPLRPQTALKDIESGEHFYPMTCASQVLMEDGTRLNAYLENFEGGGGGSNIDLSDYATKTEVQTAQTTADNAMPKSGGTFTAPIGFPKNTPVAFFTTDDTNDLNSSTVENFTGILLVCDESGVFLITRWKDGAWLDNILCVNYNTGEVVDGKLMPKNGGTFTGNVAAYSTNRSDHSLRNIAVKTTSATGTDQSTNSIIMVRK